MLTRFLAERHFLTFLSVLHELKTDGSCSAAGKLPNLHWLPKTFQVSTGHLWGNLSYLILIIILFVLKHSLQTRRQRALATGPGDMSENLLDTTLKKQSQI